MKQESFTWNIYKEYLNTAIKSGYEFIGFPDIVNKTTNRKSRLLILRHDIDYDPSWALSISKIEKQLGVRATYFFQIDSQFYSPSNKPNEDIIKAILNDGHWLGLHFDAREIADDKEIVAMVKRQSVNLEKQFNASVKTVSFHMPAYRSTGHLVLDHGRLNISSPYFYHGLEYVSDSNMDWRGKNIQDILANKKPEKVHLLIHPIWWREKYISLYEKIKILSDKTGIAIVDILTKEQIFLIGKDKKENENFIMGK